MTARPGYAQTASFMKAGSGGRQGASFSCGMRLTRQCPLSLRLSPLGDYFRALVCERPKRISKRIKIELRPQSIARGRQKRRSGERTWKFLLVQTWLAGDAQTGASMSALLSRREAVERRIQTTLDRTGATLRFQINSAVRCSAKRKLTAPQCRQFQPMDPTATQSFKPLSGLSFPLAYQGLDGRFRRRMFATACAAVQSFVPLSAQRSSFGWRFRHS